MRRVLGGVLLLALAVCSGEGVEADGEGAIWSTPGVISQGVERSVAAVGETWSAGAKVCRSDASQAPRLVSVEPVEARGDVRLEGIGVRVSEYSEPGEEEDSDVHAFATYLGVPARVGPIRGFIVPTACTPDDRQIGEIVVTLTKTGPGGGALDGLRVTYEVEGEERVTLFRYHFGLCGTAGFSDPCQP